MAEYDDEIDVDARTILIRALSRHYKSNRDKLGDAVDYQLLRLAEAGFLVIPEERYERMISGRDPDDPD